jgi:tetratricopeptide (TPR) repeat protein
MAERRALARRLGAGTMIWGDISRAGDSLHIEAQLVDTRSGRVVLALDPVSGSAGSAERMAAVERLRQRVMGGFGAVLGTPNVEWQVYSVPPSYEAYREALAGEEAGWRFEFDEAQRHYARAAALDTTYVSAKTSGAFAAALQGDCRAADSIVTALAPVHPQLLAGDRAALDWAAATCDHDLEGSIRAGRALLAVAPRSAAMTVLTNIGLQHAGRMHEALAVLTGLDPERAGLHGAPLTIYQQFLLENLHYLGRYQEEFRRAESRLRQDSADAGVLIRRAVALGALGRIAEAERSTLGWEQRAGPHPTYFTPASMLTCTALEFREHGHPEAARRLLERAAAWYASHLPAGAAEETPNSCTSIFFDPRYYLARWDEARAIYERALGDSTNVLNLAALGALAVRRGDRETARRIDARLTRWDDGHAPAGSSAAETYGFRARLAALRGDRDSAVALFRRQNYRGPRLFHADPDLDSLRGYPPYEELVRLRD